jgi:tripartite-type tricarboxylate transporter receptor subunit TctC
VKLTNALQGVLACLMALGVAQDSASQSSTGHLNGDYPTKPIRFVVPFPASGGADAIARIIGNKLSERWNRTVVIDNRPGAGGIIGADIVAKAAPDGYTIFMGNSGPMAASVSLYKNLPYDPAKDFAPVTLVATAAQILIVNPSSPLKTLNDLIRLAKSNPG